MKLFVVGTPIGNLEDISFRAIETFKEVDFICAENPRHTLGLLNRFNIETPVKPLSQVVLLLEDGKDVALVSDAGTPGISDPGSKIVSEVSELGVEIIPIPGASALVAALSVSGLKGSKFLFLGFLPLRKGRKKLIEEIIDSTMPVVFYESPHRILKVLEALPLDREVFVARELTKIYETLYRGSVGEVLESLKSEFKGKVKGEFVVVVK
jgi:16S rRNA (cytidine1402-2'-O)-methyltransferase